MDADGPALMECERETVRGEPPVENPERLVRVALNPNHIFKAKEGDNRVKPSAFPESHLLENRLSVTRAERAGPQLLDEVVKAIVASFTPKQELEACLVLTAAAFRESNCSTHERCLAVVPYPMEASDPHPANPAHAHVGCAIPIAREDLKELREQLVKRSQLCPSPAAVFETEAPSE